MSNENNKSILFDHRKSIGVIYLAEKDYKDEWELFDATRALVASSDESGANWRWYEEARAIVEVPVNSKVKLEVFKQVPVSLKCLEDCQPDDFYSIDLSHSKLTNLSLLHIKNLTHLKILELTSTNIDSDCLTFIANLSQLESLGLSYTNVSNDNLELINNLKILKILWLNGTKVTNDGLDKICDCSQLMLLGLSSTGVDFKSLEKLDRFKNLKRLYLYNCHITSQEVEILKKKLPNCKVKFRPNYSHHGDEALLSNEELEDLSKILDESKSTKDKLNNSKSQVVRYTDKEFWQVIQKLDWSKLGDDNSVIQPAYEFLANQEVEKIYGFANMLAQKLYKLDGLQFASNIGDYSYQQNEPFLGSLFLKIRCCVIANGYEYYQKVVKEPSLMPKNIEFSQILNIANLAFKLKTSRVLKLKTKYSTQTFANKAAWEF